jgi:hypothetical protein
MEHWLGKQYGPAISTAQTPDQVGTRRPSVATPRSRSLPRWRRRGRARHRHRTRRRQRHGMRRPHPHRPRPANPDRLAIGPIPPTAAESPSLPLRRGPIAHSVVGLLGQDAVDGRTRHTKGCRNRVRALTGSVHPPRQCRLGIVESLGATDGLTACPPCIPRRRATLLAQFQVRTSTHSSTHSELRGAAFPSFRYSSYLCCFGPAHYWRLC